MKTNLPKAVLFFVFVLNLILAACGAGAPAATPTATNTSTPLPPTFTPTVTFTPTRTPTPTITPNFTATAQYEGFLALVQKYYEAGLFPSSDGTYQVMDNYSNAYDDANTYHWDYYEEELSNFIIRADIKFEAAHRESGCGFVFGSTENRFHQFVFIERSGSAVFGAAGRVYTTKPYQRNNSSDSLSVVLVVYGAKLLLLIDDQEILVYNYLDLERSAVGPAILSGGATNSETRCDFENIELWEMADN